MDSCFCIALLVVVFFVWRSVTSFVSFRRRDWKLCIRLPRTLKACLDIGETHTAYLAIAAEKARAAGSPIAPLRRFCAAHRKHSQHCLAYSTILQHLQQKYNPKNPILYNFFNETTESVSWAPSPLEEGREQIVIWV